MNVKHASKLVHAFLDRYEAVTYMYMYNNNILTIPCKNYLSEARFYTIV